MPDLPVAITHDRAQRRFETTIDGHPCVADYELAEGVMHMTHTVVHPALQGRGIAARLVEAAFAYAQTEHLKINPLCSYVRVYMQRHPETESLRA